MSADQIIFHLVQLVIHGGVFTFNICHGADGQIPFLNSIRSMA